MRVIDNIKMRVKILGAFLIVSILRCAMNNGFGAAWKTAQKIATRVESGNLNWLRLMEMRYGGLSSRISILGGCNARCFAKA